VESEEFSIANEYIPLQGQDGGFGRRIASDVEARFREQVNTIVGTVVQPIAQGLLGQATNTIRDAQEEYYYFQGGSSINPHQNTPGLASTTQFNESGHVTASQSESRAVLGGLNAETTPQMNFELQMPHQNIPLWPQRASPLQTGTIGNMQQNYWQPNSSWASAYGPTYSTATQFDTPDVASSWSMSQPPLIDRIQVQ